MYGITELSIIPIRRETSERSEMVSQLLFGETFSILNQEKDWIYIKTYNDNYEGWINPVGITYLSLDEFEKINKSNYYTVNTLTNTIILEKTGEEIIIPFASSLPNFNESNISFFIKENSYILKNENLKNIKVEDLALQFLNSPYLWGGKNPFGIDCSGFSQIIYKALGKNIPRDASQQVNVGNTINFLSDTKAGDLAFFDNEEGIITHVGIILDKNEIIHSSAKVRIDKLDQQGIYNQDFKKYTHKLRVIKRILE